MCTFGLAQCESEDIGHYTTDTVHALHGRTYCTCSKLAFDRLGQDWSGNGYPDVNSLWSILHVTWEALLNVIWEALLHVIWEALLHVCTCTRVIPVTTQGVGWLEHIYHYIHAMSALGLDGDKYCMYMHACWILAVTARCTVHNQSRHGLKALKVIGSKPNCAPKCLIATAMFYVTWRNYSTTCRIQVGWNFHGSFNLAYFAGHLPFTKSKTAKITSVC